MSFYWEMNFRGNFQDDVIYRDESIKGKGYRFMLVTFSNLVAVKLQKWLTFKIEWKRDTPIHPERLILQKLKIKFNSVFTKFKSRWLLRVFLKPITNKKIIIIDLCKQKSYVKDILQYLLISAYLRRSRALFKILS